MANQIKSIKVSINEKNQSVNPSRSWSGPRHEMGVAAWDQKLNYEQKNCPGAVLKRAEHRQGWRTNMVLQSAKPRHCGRGHCSAVWCHETRKNACGHCDWLLGHCKCFASALRMLCECTCSQSWGCIMCLAASECVWHACASSAQRPASQRDEKIASLIHSVS
jgi:hypothetical protein